MAGIGRSGTVALTCLGAFALLTLAITGGPLPALDEHIRNWSVVHQSQAARRLTVDIFWLGDVKVAGGSLLVASLAVARWARRWRLATLALSVGVLTSAAVAGLKIAVGRSEAPFAAHAVLGVGSHSYPSGHVATATVCWGLVAVMVGAAAPRVRAWGAAAAALVVLLVGYTAVYSPAHWLTDAIGGVLIGAAGVSAFVALDGARLSKRRRS